MFEASLNELICECASIILRPNGDVEMKVRVSQFRVARGSLSVSVLLNTLAAVQIVRPFHLKEAVRLPSSKRR